MPGPDARFRITALMEPQTEQQHFARFRELVLAEPELHARLRATPDPTAFVALAVAAGAERGCEFTAATVETLLREQRRAWLERWI